MSAPDLKLGHYWLQLPWGPWILGSWNERKQGFDLPGHPVTHEPEYFSEIGPRIEDQLITVAEAMDPPHHGLHLDLFEPICDFVKEANLK